MRKDIKKISLAVLALSAVSLAGVAVGGLSVREASAGTALNTLETFRVENVSVRLATSQEEVNGGFRFETLIGTEAYEGLTNVTEVGTLFVPAGFNVADESIALDENGAVLNEKVQKVVLEGGADNRRGGLATTDENGADVISYRAYINDVPETAYGAEVTARSYVIADGVAYYTETVNESVGSVATKAYYDVQSEADEVYCNEVAEGWYSPFVEAQRNEIGAYVKTTAKTYEKQYVLVEGGNATLDLTAISVSADDIVGVTVDGAFTEWSVDGSTLTYATTVGEKTLAVATTKGVYSVALVQADQVITTGDQFYNWTENWGSAEYTVLASDITAKSGTHWIHAGTFPQGRVFNGLGHTIDGFVSGKGIVQSLDGGTTTWKNVNYTNYTGDLVFYIALGGTFENVNVTGTVTNTENLLVYTINRANTVIKNCVVNVNNKVAGTALNLAKAGGDGFNDLTLIDSTIIYGNSQLNVPDTLEVKGSNYNIYDVDDVQTNYYAKVSGGNATFALSQMGETAPTTVSKLLVNGTEVQATIADGVLSYPATNTGATALMMTTDKGFRVMNIVHADNVITTWDQFVAWGTVSVDTYKQYAYTVLGNDIENPAGVTIQFISRFYKIFDGLGHTIKNFNGKEGILRRLDNGATWKNVKYTGYTQMVKDGGLLGDYLNGGIFENIEITGTFAEGLNMNYFLAKGANVDTTSISNCTFTMTGDTATTKYLYAGTPHYYKVTVANSTITYTGGTINYKTCDCAKADATKSVIMNSTINGEYIELKESGQ